MAAAGRASCCCCWGVRVWLLLAVARCADRGRRGPFSLLLLDVPVLRLTRGRAGVTTCLKCSVCDEGGPWPVCERRGRARSDYCSLCQLCDEEAVPVMAAAWTCQCVAAAGACEYGLLLAVPVCDEEDRARLAACFDVPVCR